MMSAFKVFAMKGTVMGMAAGIVIGVAFGKIIRSLVKVIIMPPIGVAPDGVDFNDLGVILQASQGETAAV